MMKPVLLALSLVAVFAFLPREAVSSSEEEISATLQKEYSRLRKIAAKLKPEYEVGGYLKGKVYGDHELLWRLAEEKGDPEVIRIYRDKGEGRQPFDVTFHHSTGIIKGRTVIRRFVGPASTGWRNDTIDAETGEYLGSQGTRDPAMDPRDLEILKKWNIRLFD